MPQIIALESDPVKSESDQYFLLRRHYDRIKQMPQFAAATLVFIPENNLGLEASHLNTMVKGIAKVRTYWEKDKPGICKTQRITNEYQFLTTHMIRECKIRFSTLLFTTSRDQNPRTIKSLLMDQTLRFHREMRPDGKIAALTGKQGDKQDDLLIATMMSVYWGRAVAMNGAANLE